MTASAWHASPIDHPESRTSYQVIATSHEMRAMLEETLASLGVSVAQWTVLLQLLVEPGRSSADLARSSVVSQQAISGMVTRLERDDLLTRRPHPDHGRIQQLTITERGEQVTLEADERVRQLEQDLRDFLGDSDSEALRSLLLRVRDFLSTRRG